MRGHVTGARSQRWDRRSDLGVLDVLLDRLYARLGSRIVLRGLVLSMVLGSVAGAVVAASSVRYLDYSASELLAAEGIGSASCLVCGTVLARALMATLSPLLCWSGANRTSELAPEAWRAAVRLPGTLAVRGGCMALAALALATPFFVLTGRSAAADVGFVLAGAVSAAPGVITFVFVTDLSLRPLLRDVAGFLPDGFEPGAQRWGVRAKVLAPLPFLTLYSALTVGAFGDLVARGPLRLAVALGIALAAMIGAGVVFWVATRTLLDPIDDLLAATSRVSAGDVVTPVLVVSADELGGLAHGFNRMLASLRRHEQQSAAAEDERRRLERDIHDGAQQRLAAIAMWLDGLDNLLDAGAGEEARVIARRASDELREAIVELRRLSHGLPPPALVLGGFDVAIEELVARTPGASLRGCAGEPLVPAVGVAAYYAVAEALTNALRHSGAAQIDVVIARRNGSLRIDVRDDGCGGARVEDGSGLRGLTARLAAQNGQLSIESTDGEGTVLRIELPVDPERASRVKR